MQFVFLADFFVENGILGGGELNNQECIKILREKGYEIEEKNCFLIDLNFLKKNTFKKFIIGNFLSLKQECVDFITEKISYIIYEHDHKYLKSRDPSSYKNFLAPEDQLRYIEFYKNAKTVLCQSSLHMSIIEKNLKFDNLVNLGGNLWSLEILDYIEELSKTKKRNIFSIIDSINDIKNSYAAIKYCKIKEMQYELIKMMSYKDFLSHISQNKGLIFFPKVVETLNRVIVEARMMNCEIITNAKLIGALSENWFKFKGKDLINVMRKKREEIPNKIINGFEL